MRVERPERDATEEGLLGRIRRLEDALAREKELRGKYELEASRLADELKEVRRLSANLQLENERLAAGHFTLEEMHRFRPIILAHEPKE